MKLLRCQIRVNLEVRMLNVVINLKSVSIKFLVKGVIHFAIIITILI